MWTSRQDEVDFILSNFVSSLSKSRSFHVNRAQSPAIDDYCYPVFLRAYTHTHILLKRQKKKKKNEYSFEMSAHVGHITSRKRIFLFYSIRLFPTFIFQTFFKLEDPYKKKLRKQQHDEVWIFHFVVACIIKYSPLPSKKRERTFTRERILFNLLYL